MPRSKLKKFTEIKTRINIIEPSKFIFSIIKDKWAAVFGNQNPIVLELACGVGEYTTTLASLNSTKNYVGVDVKGDRLWQGSTNALEMSLTNAAFLQTPIQFLPRFFEPHSIDEIWIIHPDPQLNKPRSRLTSKYFLDIYQSILRPGGVIHLKTDSAELYDFTLKTSAAANCTILANTNDLYTSPLLANHFGITTHFEKKAIENGKTIKYLSFTFH
jgi:tRNA (guanine-N7-)-methyltransferase